MSAEEQGQPGANPYAFQPCEINAWHAEKSKTPADSPISPASVEETRHEKGVDPSQKVESNESEKVVVEEKTIEKPAEGADKTKDKPEIDLESLPPEVAGEIKRLQSIEGKYVGTQKKLTEAEKALGTQGRELGAARKAVEERVVSHTQGLQKAESDYQATRRDIREEKLKAEDTAREIRSQIRSASTPEEAATLRQEAERYQNFADEQGTYLNRMETHYNSWVGERQGEFASHMEEALFAQFPELKTVQNQFDEFCRDIDVDPLRVRTGSIEKLYRVYSRCLAASRGTPEAMAKIKEGSDKLAVEVGSKKRGASGPASGSSGKDTGKEKPKGWADEHFPSQRPKRDDPNAY
jgi:hypothetical protein